MGVIQKANSERTETEEETVTNLIDSLYPAVSEFPGVEQEGIEQQGEMGNGHHLANWKLTYACRVCATMLHQGPMRFAHPSGRNCITITRVSS